jgi:hypothetical protein
MNHIELKIDGETCRFSWATGDGIEKVQAVVESFKQVMMDAGYQPETVNKVFNTKLELMNVPLYKGNPYTGDNK